MSDAQVETFGLGSGLKRVIKERVLVAWNENDRDDTRYFGCLSEGHDRSKDCTGRLSLEIHRSEEPHRALLVNFHLPVKIPASTSRRAKDMYVVLPTSSLSMSLVGDTLTDAARHHLPCSDSGKTYLRMDLKTDDSHPPYTIMPEVLRCAGQIGRRVKGTPRRLLIYLKSLSMAKSWNIYLENGRKTQDQIQRLCELLRSGTYEPKIKLDCIYPNGVRGQINNWNDYPFSQTQQGTSLRYLPSSPPAYGAIYGDTRPYHPPSDESAKSPESVLIWKTSPPGVSSEMVPRNSSPAPPEATGKRKKHDADISSDEESRVNKRPEMTYSSLAAQIPTDAGFERKLEMARALSPTQADSDEHFLLENVGAAIASSISDVDLVETPAPASPKDSPSRDQSLSSQHSIEARQATPANRPAELSTRSILQSHSVCIAESAEWTLYVDMVQLLYYAMGRDVNAYHTYKDHFLEMSYRAEERNAPDFHFAKRICLRDLNKRAARGDLQPPSTSEEMETQVLTIQTWIDEEISREAYIYVDRQFDCIEGVLLRAEELGPSNVLEEFRIRKAECLAAAFFTRKGADGGYTRRAPVLCMTCIRRIFTNTVHSVGVEQ